MAMCSLYANFKKKKSNQVFVCHFCFIQFHCIVFHFLQTKLKMLLLSNLHTYNFTCKKLGIYNLTMEISIKQKTFVSGLHMNERICGV